MSIGCEHCGAAVAESDAFCTKCGAKRRAGVSDSLSAGHEQPGTHAVAAPSKPPGRIPKIFLAAVVFAVFLVATITMTVIYAAHRARQKAALADASSSSDSNADKNLDDLKSAIGAASTSTGASSSETPSSVSSPPAGTSPTQSIPASPHFVVIPPAVAAAPIVAAPASGDPSKDWALKYERTENGPEADLVVRTGDINNLGFGWPQGFDPFSGNSTPQHDFPWKPRDGAPEGTDRIMIGSALDPSVRSPTRWLSLHDGYSGLLESCEVIEPPPPGQVCRERYDSMPQAVRLAVGTLPPQIKAVVVQIFVDDFQAAAFGSHFQVSLNGTRIPTFENAINSLNQTGPIGKLLTLKLLPEYWPLLNSGEVKLLIDDPTTKQGDGYAIDFARILVNPHQFKYQVSLLASVVDADKHTPIPGATVTAGLGSVSTDQSGKCQLTGLPAGLVTVTAAAPGYDENSVPVDLPAGQSGNAEVPLHRHQEDTAALEKELAQTGQATIYGIHFDTDSAKLRGDSLPALNAVLGLINHHPESRWTIGGHTDDQGNAAHNQSLSQNRSASVIAWLKDHGVDSARLVPQGFGATRPVADNSTASGRALNRRVEVAIAK